MKILFHIPTETLTSYPRADDEPVVGLDPEYDIFDLVQELQPIFDPATQYLTPTETIDVPTKTVTRGWQIHDIPIPTTKIWANVQEFMAVFTMAEKAAIALSVDPTIAALRLELSTWLSEVHADDVRVVLGLDKLVELGIIAQARKDEITTI
jgi:hypothetical protein